MSRIFISHSSLDSALAERLRAALQARGYGLFLDFDTRRGIEAGEPWKDRLYLELRRCDALLILWSRMSAASRWCTAEITFADASGKPMFPLQVDDAPLDPVLVARQALPLPVAVTDGQLHDVVERLCRGLSEAGIDALAPPTGRRARAPYPGLSAFDADDEAHYFGRSEEIAVGREALSRLREHERERGMLVIVGASGIGKSSLLRAGWLPKLRRDPSRWAVAGPVRPGREPFTNLTAALASALREAFERDGSAPASAVAQALDTLDARSRAADRGEPCDGLASEMLALVREVRRRRGRESSTVLLAVDQLEELFDPALATVRGAFLSTLAKLHRDGTRDDASASEVALTGTVRIDSLHVLAADPGLSGLSLLPFALMPISRAGLREAIVRPAHASAGVTLSNELVETLLDDAGSPPALPLIAFTLEQMWDGDRQGNELTIDHYRQVGGVQGAVAEVAGRALAVFSDPAAPERTMRTAFLLMARVDPDAPGRVARRRADWALMSDSVRPVLRALADRRLLVIGQDASGATTVEVAHEALFTAWKPLAQWISEAGSALQLQHKLEDDARDWESARSRATSDTDRPGWDVVRRWQGPDLLAAIHAIDATGGSTAIRAFVEDAWRAELERVRADRQRIADRLERLQYDEQAIEFDDGLNEEDRRGAYDWTNDQRAGLRSEQAHLLELEEVLLGQRPVFVRWHGEEARARRVAAAPG